MRRKLHKEFKKKGGELKKIHLWTSGGDKHRILKKW